MKPWYLCFDVESIGLHGVGFAVGAVLMDPEGRIVDEFYAACPPALAIADSAQRGERWYNSSDIGWVADNVLLERYTHESPLEVRAAFWGAWREIAVASKLGEDDRLGALYLAADVPWPVEANFLTQGIHDNWPESKWQGPYPLIDIASVRLAAGFDPLATEKRLYENELPVHNPLADARQSARLLHEALERIRVDQENAAPPRATSA